MAKGKERLKQITMKSNEKNKILGSKSVDGA